MRSTKRQWGWNIDALRNRLRWPALLLLFCIAAHSFDSCTAHFGLPLNSSQKTTHQSYQDASKNPRFLCQSAHKPLRHASDICEVISEISTVAAYDFQLATPDVVVSSAYAILIDVFILEPPSGTMRSRDGPDVVTLVSLCLRSTLPGRSPPFSA